MTEFVSPHDKFEINEGDDQIILENEGEENEAGTTDVELRTEDIELVEQEPVIEQEPVKKTPKTPRAEQRIGLLTRKNKELEEERNNLLAEREQMYKFIQEREKASAEEANKMRTTTLESLKKEMEQAFETGDTKTFFDAQERYLAARESAIVSRVPQAVPSPQPQTSAQISDEEQAWVQRSGFVDWPNEAREDALRVFTSLKRQGQEPTDRDFWDTLDRRLQKVPSFEKLYAVFGEEDDVVTNNELKTKTTSGKLSLNRVQSPGRMNVIAGQNEGKKGVVLTAEDKQTMLMFNFNPNSPEDVKTFLKYRG